MFTYLLINILSIAPPFVLSFDKRHYFYGQWKYFFPGMLITLAFFIVWDVYFTQIGVWGFNDRYLTGIKIINLPVEEWLFFVTIPFACVFTYEAATYLSKRDYFGKYANAISWTLVVVLTTIGIIYIDRLYTSITFLLTSAFILTHLLFIKSDYLGRFYFSYMFVIFPFFIVNGILTGSWIEEEVVWYNNAENLGIRIFTIPIEDSIYGMLLIMMNVTFLEYFRRKARK